MEGLENRGGAIDDGWDKLPSGFFQIGLIEDRACWMLAVTRHPFFIVPAFLP